MSKNYPIIVPFPAFHHVLRDALDAIGAFSLTNAAWEQLATGGTAGATLAKPADGDLRAPHDHISWQAAAREVP